MVASSRSDGKRRRSMVEEAGFEACCPPVEPGRWDDQAEKQKDNKKQETSSRTIQRETPHSSHGILAFAPGEALAEWLAEQNENATQPDDPLIEEPLEEAPRAPSAQEVAARVACQELREMLPSLTLSRDSIAQTNAAVLKVAAAGAAPRAVAMVLDAAAAAPSPRQRLPLLYLLDMALRSELRHAPSMMPKNVGGQISPSPAFPRAIAAGIRQLINLLLEDDDVVSKAEKVLHIWRRDAAIPDGVLGEVLAEISKHRESRHQDAEEKKPDTVGKSDGQVLLKEAPNAAHQQPRHPCSVRTNSSKYVRMKNEEQPQLDEFDQGLLLGALGADLLWSDSYP
jgi:hypothetical protein